MSKNISTYQDRYLLHQRNKKDSLSGKYKKNMVYKKNEIMAVKKVFKNRSSDRVFSGESVDIKEVLEMVDTSPSSCNRKGVKYKIIEDREDKEILSGLLVGGVGWIYRANKIVLIYTDMEAYKSPAEKDFMPYLDAGVLIQSFYLSCEVMELKSCCVNPNIRKQNKEFFNKKFLNNSNKLLSVMAIGK